MNNYNIENTRNFLLSILIFTTILLLTVGVYFELNGIAIYILVPLLSLISLSMDIKTLNSGNSEFYLFIIVIVLCFIAVFFENIDYNNFIFSFNKLFIAFLASYIPLGINKNNKLQNIFHISYIVAILLIILLEIRDGNFSPTNSLAPTADRDDFFFNANYYGYLCLFANFSLFYFHLKWRNLTKLILLIVIPLLFILLSFATQSRAALIFIILANALFWFWVYETKTKSQLRSILKFVFLTSISIFLVRYAITFYETSAIKDRFAYTSEDGRIDLISESLTVFLDHPFLGVGVGQFPNYSKTNQFSHNSIAEALSEHGLLIGGVILLILVLPLYKAYKFYWDQNKSPEVKLCLLFFGLFLLFNNFYVHYKTTISMLYFFLFVAYLNEIRLKNNQETIS